MKTGANRRFTVLDAMILVAAAAAGIAAARAYSLGASDSSSVAQIRMAMNREQAINMAILQAYEEPGRQWRSNAPDLGAIQRETAGFVRRISLEKLSSSCNVFLFVWTLALVCLGLRRPRPRVRCLVLQAGWAACLTAIVVLVVRALSVIVTWGAELSRPMRSPWPAIVRVFDDLGDYVRPAIVAVWVVIAMSRRGRMEWSSIGWLTTLTAAVWVLLIFGEAAIRVVAPL